MIIYDLICDAKHEFEGWFSNARDFEDQRECGFLNCPVCDSPSVHKKPSAAKLKAKTNAGQSKKDKAVVMGNSQSSEHYAQVQKILGKLHNYVEENFENVGSRFTDEALSIHRGEKEAANIRGTASKEQVKQLEKEGVKALPLPEKPANKDKLN